jgi:hypothetical protein
MVDSSSKCTGKFIEDMTGNLVMGEKRGTLLTMLN